MARSQVLVCTSNRDGGWCHSTTTFHSEKKIVLDVYRIEEGGKIVHHPVSGKCWKYGKAKNQRDAIDKIRDVTDKIGLMVGSLVVYSRA